MARERFLLEVDGQEARDLYSDVSRIEVELDDEQAATFRIELSTRLGSDGTWTHVDDGRIAPWKPVAIHVGFDDGFEPLVSGFVTRVDTTFDADAGGCRVEVWGSDGSALLDRVERLRGWPNRKDSDIAAEIFAEYALTPQIDDTAVVHGSAVSTIMQRETDLQLLRRLAARNGFECFVEDRTGYFRAPPAVQEPQPTLAVRFGDQTNVTWYVVSLDATRPSEIGMFQLDRTEKTVLSTVVDNGAPALGADGAADLLPSGVTPARAFVAMNASTGLAEMEPLCRTLYDRGDWFVTGEGVVDGNRYGSVLQPRRPVTIKGVGERHSGVYAVGRVTHAIDAGGYTQRFQVRRNGLRPTGAEDFGAGASRGGLP
jgi:hypothetical protein